MASPSLPGLQAIAQSLAVARVERQPAPAWPPPATSGLYAEQPDSQPCAWRQAGLELGDGNREGWRAWVEARLQAAGWWARSAWWDHVLRAGASAMVMVERVGRRGAKSSTLCRVVV